MPKVNAEIQHYPVHGLRLVVSAAPCGVVGVGGRGLCMDSFVIDSSQFDCFWFIGSFFCCLFTVPFGVWFT